jgi:hypothetical protein
MDLKLECADSMATPQKLTAQSLFLDKTQWAKVRELRLATLAERVHLEN